MSSPTKITMFSNTLVNSITLACLNNEHQPERSSAQESLNQEINIFVVFCSFFDARHLLFHSEIHCRLVTVPGLRSCKESEVFGWSRSRFPKNTRSQIFLSNPSPEVQLNHFLYRTPKLGILTHAC